MTLEEIEKRISGYYNDLEELSDLKATFKEVLVKFLQSHRVEHEIYTSLLCTIHTNFKEGHNCVACNLDESNRRIEDFLFGYKHFTDPFPVMTNFIIQMYLQAEQIFAYLKIIKLSNEDIKENFQPLITIKRWANFLKHPKFFLLVHHPYWDYERDIPSLYKEGAEKIIDTEFVNAYYAGDKKNEELYALLAKKKEVMVLFPNPITLIDEFCKAQNKFVKLIEENAGYRDLLDNEATIRDYYNELDKDIAQIE